MSNNELHERNNLALILDAAAAVAHKDGVSIAIVHDPIANAEDPGDFSYCPAAGSAIRLLFPYGTHTHTILPNGAVHVITPIPLAAR
mgnify:CR=1 FL=1|jgi:hypothetical protein|tara:strand:- start:430 stop:690 length:261 start_codon:yes stop_codon:yes gene_type:complete